MYTVMCIFVIESSDRYVSALDDYVVNGKAYKKNCSSSSSSCRFGV